MRIHHVIALLAVAGCAGDGCSCMGPIPGGFPPAERQTNAVQARLSATGLEYIAGKFPDLVAQIVPDGLVFDVPESCGGDPTVCCGYPVGYCQIGFDVEPYAGDLPRLELTPVDMGATTGLLEVTMRARVATLGAMPVHKDGLFGGVDCWVSVNTEWQSPTSMRVDTTLWFEDDALTGTTRVEVGDATVYNINEGDVSIDGGFLCGFASAADAAEQMRAQLEGQMAPAIQKFLCLECSADADCAGVAGASCNAGICEVSDASGFRCMQKIGTSGRLPAASLLGGLASPERAGAVDLYLAPGGFASSLNGGLDLGVRTGLLSADPSVADSCVPTATAPPAPSIAPSTVLQSNVHPVTGQPFDLGLAVHKSWLDRFAWAAYSSGFLCIDVGASRVPLLSSDSFGILTPSLGNVLHGDNAPLFLLIRPQQPPHIALGAGTFTETGGIAEPLLTIALDQLHIDFYALVDGAYVRIMTLEADLAIPLNLDSDGAGSVVPVMGDLAEAFTNITVLNSGLLGEPPSELASKFPVVLSIALPMLADKLGAFLVPSFAGMTLQIAPGGITSIEGNEFLAVFGDLAPGAAKPGTRVTTTASIARTLAPPTAAFAAARLDDTLRPAFELELGGVAAGDPRAALEWQVRVDDGFWSPYGRDPNLLLSREAFWMQGKHTIAVRARVVGRPETTDDEAIVLTAIVDTVAPAVMLAAAETEIVVDATDAVSAPEALRLSYRWDDGAWTTAGAPPFVLDVPDGAERLEVVARDEVGNTGTGSVVIDFHGRTPSSGGCGCQAASREPLDVGEVGGWLALAALALLIARRRARLALLALVVAVIGCGGCGGSGGGDGADAGGVDPTVVNPGPIGRWSDLAAADGRVVVSAYEQNFGDLVVSEVDQDGRLAFSVVDGAPDGPVVLDPTGYRGGVRAEGEDVGAWTSIALGALGEGARAQVAYMDRDRGVLKLAREDGPGAWTKIDVGDGGSYVSLLLDAQDTPGIAYMSAPLADGMGGFTTELRWAQAASASPSGPQDFTVTVIDQTAISCLGLCGDDVCVASTLRCAPEDVSACAATPCTEGNACVGGACVPYLASSTVDLPEGTGLFASAGRLPDGRVVVAFHDRVRGDLLLGVRDAAGAWTKAPLDVGDSEDRGQWASLAVAPDGTVHVAHQDALADALLVTSWKDGVVGAVETVDDGRRGVDRIHPVGAGTALVMTSTGLAVAYQDGADVDVLLARRAADGWTHETLLGGDVGIGFFTAAAVDESSGVMWLSTYGYDQSVLEPGRLTVVRID